MALAELTRIFRTGSIQLPDPNPTLTPEQVKDYYSSNYTHLAGAVVEPPSIEGTKMIINFKPAPVKTKG
jgi:PRTRC genetic system protein C